MTNDINHTTHVTLVLEIFLNKRAQNMGPSRNSQSRLDGVSGRDLGSSDSTKEVGKSRLSLKPRVENETGEREEENDETNERTRTRRKRRRRRR